MYVRYEEKNYEGLFNVELANRSSVWYPPGQVQEGLLGPDSVAFSRNRRLWRFLGHPFWFVGSFSGIPLREIADEVEIEFNEVIRAIPRMKVNLLFQYKRPEYMTRNWAEEWPRWGRNYFRYKIEKDQQERLACIHNKFGAEVLVLYAAPALTDVNDIIDAALNRNLIERSNFAKAIDLTDHRRNTYVEAGTYSIACTEPKRIKRFDLLKELDLLVGQARAVRDKDNKGFIITLRQGIEDMMRRDEQLGSAFEMLLGKLESYRMFQIVYSFLVMATFRNLTGIQWAIRYDA